MNTKRITFTINVDMDFKFWSLIPSININLRYHELELEWLCFGIYTSVKGDGDDE